MGRRITQSRQVLGMIRIWLPLFAFTIQPLFALANKGDFPTAADFSISTVIQRLAKRIEPDLAGKPERLPHYVDFFRTEVGNDSRLFAFNVFAKSKEHRRVE